jgi:hypothetical protein
MTSEGSDLSSGCNTPSPPPPEYDAMISQMPGDAFNLSAPEVMITQPHSFSKPIFAKPSADSSVSIVGLTLCR